MGWNLWYAIPYIYSYVTVVARLVFRNMQMNPSQESLTCLFCHLHVYLQSDAFFVLYGLELIMLGHDHHKDGNGITAVRYYSKA